MSARLWYGRASGWGARAGASPRAIAMGVWDGVSVLQAAPAVKRKARNGCRGWSGGGRLTDEAW
jgi:hypothetical protein